MNLTEPQSASPGKTALSKPEFDRKVIEETYGAAVLAAVTAKQFGGNVEMPGFKAYRDGIVAGAGQSTDPIETMLVEQLIWAHFRVADLQIQATIAGAADITNIYTTAAARLMAEFRRSAMALREYRSPFVPRQVTVVKQQNIAAGGDQQIAFVEGGVSPTAVENSNADTKLASNSGALCHVDPAPAFSPADCRPFEPIKANGHHTRR